MSCGRRTSWAGGRLVRLNFLVEGQTEQAFVVKVLAPVLAGADILCCAALVSTGRKHGRIFRGGVTSYGKARRDLINWMKQQPGNDVFFTTMFDMYGLPMDFPGVEKTGSCDPLDRARRLEQSFLQDVMAESLQERIDAARRFIPYFQVHEFEALLFSDVSKWAGFDPGSPSLEGKMRDVRGQFATPEHINTTNPPSKRIMAVANYDKVADGRRLAERIGLAAMRGQCAHFKEWVDRLSALKPLDQ